MRHGISISIISIVIVFYLISNSINLLYVNDEIDKDPDFVCVYALDYRRIEKAAELLKKYPNSIGLFSSPTGKYIDKIFKYGVSDSSRVVIINGCQNTFDEVNIFNDYIFKRDEISDRIVFEGSKWNNQKIIKDKELNIAMVSSPFHMRRIKIISDMCFRNENANIYYVSADVEKFYFENYSKLWRPEFRQVIFEFFKIVNYFVFK